ncbi:hypothetical protein V8F06_000954 [Rhypophila decipiens]
MAGGFSPVDEARCEHYAAFASHLGRKEFDYIYWGLFIFVILMLFLSSWQYSGDFDAVQNFEIGSREYRKKMKKCLAICSVYSAVSVVAIVMEVYALMALQFCDGEDLMSLYWSTWTVLQVGALIAIFGILLSVFNGLRGNKNPPWALALGTPVLVVAGIGHAVHGAMRKRVQKVRTSRSMSRSRDRRSRGRGMSVGSSNAGMLQVHHHQSCSTSRGRSMSEGMSLSREATIRVDDSEREDSGEYKAKLVGYTPEGSPIIQFYEEPPTFRISAERGSVLGRSENGQVIVAFRKNMTILTEGFSSGGGGGGGYYDGGVASSWREKSKSRSNSLVPPTPLTPLTPASNANSTSFLLPPASPAPPSTPRPAVVRIATPDDDLPLPPV